MSTINRRTRRTRPRHRMTFILIAFIICAGILGFLMLQRYRQVHVSAPVPPQPEQAGTLPVTLFFAAPDGDGLMREGRNIDACGDTDDCVGAVIEELASGPLGSLEPVLPPNTVVNGVKVENGVATVDLGEGLVEGLPEGSSAEMTAVYSMIDSIAVNFPNIKMVKFLIEGKTVDTLKGHLDLRQPLAPDFSLERHSAK